MPEFAPTLYSRVEQIQSHLHTVADTEAKLLIVGFAGCAKVKTSLLSGVAQVTRGQATRGQNVCRLLLSSSPILIKAILPIQQNALQDRNAIFPSYC